MAKGRADVRDIRVSGSAARMSPRALGAHRAMPVLALSGTTADLEPGLAERILPMLGGVVAVAAQDNVAIVTGGTDAGVFHLLAIALSSAVVRPKVVIGVVPDGLVSSDRSDGRPAGASVAAAAHHSVIVRVPGTTWGDETEILTRLVADVSAGEPAVCLLVGGGDVSRREVIDHLASGRSLVVLAGSGRLADAIAAGDVTTEDDLSALLASSDVRVVQVDDGPDRLRDELRELLVPDPPRSRRDRVALMSALPRWRVPLDPPRRLVPPDALRECPLLSDRIGEVDRQIFPAFVACDRTARVEQNRHRWFIVLSIAGGMLTTVFGALQAWLQTARWPGVVVAGMGAATSALVVVARRQGSLQSYLSARVRAERLRSLYFEYVAAPPSVDPDDRAQHLRELEQRVVRIQTEPVSP